MAFKVLKEIWKIAELSTLIENNRTSTGRKKKGFHSGPSDWCSSARRQAQGWHRRHCLPLPLPHSSAATAFSSWLTWCPVAIPIKATIFFLSPPPPSSHCSQGTAQASTGTTSSHAHWDWVMEWMPPPNWNPVGGGSNYRGTHIIQGELWLPPPPAGARSGGGIYTSPQSW